jgi:transcriptional regulator with XRE-family HTH domain
MTGAHDPQYIELIARLRNARKAKQLSQKEFGDLLDKTQSFVSKVETCERRLDVIEAAKWCIALGISLDDALPPLVKKALEDAAGKGR